MTPKRKTILVVEDEQPILGMLTQGLAREGFAVLEAHDGAEGLATALRERPDLILLDIIMPNMDGMTMLGKLRDDEWGKTVPVIILTNLTSADDARMKDVAKMEPAYYLVKTEWKLEDVVKKVKERLGVQ